MGNPKTSNRNEIINLLVSHPEVFIDRISYAYPLPESLADKYINLLNWRRISENPHMTVSLDFFKKHEKRWVWKDEYATYCSIWMNNSSALRWSDEFLELYKDRIWWDEISRCDDRFTWTEELIGRFFNHLSWEGLSCNESLPWSKYPGMMNGILTINKPIFITFNNSCAYNSF